MELLPNDIRQHRFRKGLRGYNTEEVDPFLAHLATTFAALLESRQRSEGQAKAIDYLYLGTPFGWVLRCCCSIRSVKYRVV